MGNDLDSMREPTVDVLSDQIALVTGAGRGIGRGIAVALAQAGADVAINYYDLRSDAEDTARQVEQAGRRALSDSGRRGG